MDFWRAVRIAVTVTALLGLLAGQVWQAAYTQGHAVGVATGRSEGAKGQYDRGYASAVSDYEEGLATWAEK